MNFVRTAFTRVIRFLQGLSALTKSLATGEQFVILKSQSTFFGDRMATQQHVAFLHDQKFMKAFNGAFDAIPPNLDFSGITWRGHIVTWAAQRGISLGGDFVECGVWYGTLSRTICNYVDFKNYSGKFYLIDSWGKMEGSHSNTDYDPDIYEAVKGRFSDSPNVHLIRGLVPDALSEVPSKHVSYLSIDMNGSTAERAALEFFYSKVLPGGVIYFDDYGWVGYTDLRKTVDEFFADKPEELLHFPSGNSIVIKQ